MIRTVISNSPLKNSCKCAIKSYALIRGLMDQSTIYKDKVEPGK